MAKAFKYYGNAKTKETQRFVEMFDPTEYMRRLKPNLKPYSKIDDETFTVSHRFSIG